MYLLEINETELRRLRYTFEGGGELSVLILRDATSFTWTILIVY